MVLRAIAIDNGGSEMRYLPIPGEVNAMPNDFVTIEKEDFRVKEVEDRLELCEILQAPKSFYLGIIARGAAGRLYDSKAMSFDSQTPKTSSQVYYRQYIYAIARDAMQHRLKAIAEHRPLSSEMDAYVLATCIPIKEHSGKNDCVTRLKASLVGEYEVEFPLLDEPRKVRFKLTTENIGVVPEGGVAMTAIRNKVQADDFSLVVDMGHVSVDIAMFKGRSMYGSKVISSPYAGSTLIALVRSALADEGYFVNEQQALSVLETNQVRHGNQSVDVSDLVRQQKAIYVSNYLKNEILQILNMNAVNAKQVQYLIPLGAGMNDVHGSGSIVQELIRECGLSSAEVVVLAEDLRYVNIKQTAMFAEAMLKKVKFE